MTANHVMNHCWFKGLPGDELHTVLCAIGLNLRWLLRAVTNMGLDIVLLILTAWMGAARVLKELHLRINGGGNRMLITSGHQMPASAPG
jgi:hypothetical protein